MDFEKEKEKLVNSGTDTLNNDGKKLMWTTVCDGMKKIGHDMIDRGIVDQYLVSPWELGTAILTTFKEFVHESAHTEEQLDRIIKAVKEKKKDDKLSS